MTNSDVTGKRITIKGRVQGVGFRPFIYLLAKEEGLPGWVQNTNEGVSVTIVGSPQKIRSFCEKLKTRAPVAAKIKSVRMATVNPDSLKDFQIRDSRNISGDITEISPDIAVCDKCLKDISTQSHRLNYPLINCTHCGPRFSIIRDLPYDRKHTTMDVFPMCHVCESEYNEVTDRRFHAQPVACNHCGPRYELFEKGILRSSSIETIISRSVAVIESGGILAIKGIGGFHLACNAFDEEAVGRLRIRKRRETKPLAVLFRDLESLSPYVELSSAEKKSLCSWQRPVVLLRMRRGIKNPMAGSLNQGLSTLGVMLPYMPFHHLLMKELPTPAIVLTSGNFSEDPVIIDNDKALEQFDGVADVVISHQRSIYNRVDDSVVRIVAGKERVFRRARGFCPDPIPVKEETEGILAMGGELANCFCIGKGKQAYLSQHIGDLKNPATQHVYQETIDRLIPLFRTEIKLIVTDLHPEYFSTKHALEIQENLRKKGKTIMIEQVQHHHAHITSCMAEHNLTGPVIGIAFDGTGLGTDGKIWGSEFFIAGLTGFERVSHFEYLPMPGGDKAIEEPWRMTLAWLDQVFHEDLVKLDVPFLKQIDPGRVTWIKKMIRQGVNCPHTCGAGRYFDALAALLGLCFTSDYEGEGPMKLEAITQKGITDRYSLHHGSSISFQQALREIITDIQLGTDPGIISTKFHNSIISAIFDTACRIRKRHGLSKVVLSGGVFQNLYLTEGVLKRLKEDQFKIYTHAAVPPADGGIALGQLLVAAKRRINYVFGSAGKSDSRRT